MLLTQLQSDLNKSLKERDEIKTSTLRMLLSALNYKKIEVQRELTDEDVFSVIRKSVKQHEESIAMFKKGNRQDLVQKEEKEKEILSSYLPKQLSDEEIEIEVKKVIENLKSQNQDLNQMGRVIGMVMKELKGKVDGGKAAEIVKKLISK